MLPLVPPLPIAGFSADRRTASVGVGSAEDQRVVPTLINPEDAVPSCSTPLKLEKKSRPPVVNVAGLPPLLVTVPLPANAPTVLEKPLRSMRELTVKAECGLNAVVEPASSVRR